MRDAVVKPQTMRLPDLVAVLPTAASVFAIVLGCVATSEAIRAIFGPLGQSPSVSLAGYVYFLTHLAVGTGLVLGGALSLLGLWKSSNAVLLAGQLGAVASLGGMLALETLSLWALGFTA